MSKRNPLIFLMVVATMVVLFAATQVAQAADCTLNDSVTSNGNKYTVTVVPGPIDADVKTFPYPVVDTTTGKTWYQYDYELDNTDVDHVYISIPYRCSDPIKMHPTFISANEMKEPGEGSGGIGEGDYSVQILVVPPTVNRVSYVMDRDTLGPVSVFETKGKFTYTGNTSIAGVGYVQDFLIKNTIEYRWVGPTQLKLEINYRDCTFTAYDVDDLTTPLTQFPVTDLKITKGNGTAQNLNETWTHGKCEQFTFHTGDNSCVILAIGGYACTICW